MTSFNQYLIFENLIKGEMFGLSLKEGIERAIVYILNDVKQWYWDGYIICSFIKKHNNLYYFRIMNSHKEVYDFTYQGEGSISEFILCEEPIIKITNQQVNLIPFNEIPLADRNREIE